MRWSKLKQQVEAMFAECVRGRVGLWTTRYEKAHDRFGRSWITVDGREIQNMSNYLACGDSIADGHPDRFDAGVFAGYDLPMAMREYLTLSIDAAVASPNPLIRALAVLDRRTGERRLSHMVLSDEVPVVRELLTFRRGARSARSIATDEGACQ